MADVKVQLSISVAGGGGGALTVDASGVPASASVGVPYSGAIKVSGGQAPYSFSVSAGALPDGLVLNTDGTITGTPTAAGSFSFEVDVKDVVG